MLFFLWFILDEPQFESSDVDVWTETSKRIGEQAISRVDDHGGLEPVAVFTIIRRKDIISI